MWKVGDIEGTSAVNAGEMGQSKGDIPSTDQRAKRAYAIYTDQHGRPWGATIENRTGDPCGPLEPQFVAPLRPLDKYITVNSRRRQIQIRYAEIIQDIEEANQGWDLQLREYARKNYGTAAPAAIANPPADLLDMVGPRPNERREPWEAAMQGNKWVLGLAPNKPAWAAEFFPDGPVARKNTFALEITRQYPDEDASGTAASSIELKWAGPVAGWRLPDGRTVPKNDGETSEEHKARALNVALTGG